MKIVLYPDPVLRRGTEEIPNPGPEWAETAREMLDLMYETGGVGLAAPQVGLAIGLLVLNPTGEKDKPEEEMILFNPKIVAKKGKEWGLEGCLSFPGISGEVQRSLRIVVEAVDIEGKEVRLEAEDFLARVIQHEMDHLKGIIFVDRFSPGDKIKAKPALEALEDRYAKARSAAKA